MQSILNIASKSKLHPIILHKLLSSSKRAIIQSYVSSERVDLWPNLSSYDRLIVLYVPLYSSALKLKALVFPIVSSVVSDYVEANSLDRDILRDYKSSNIRNIGIKY